MSVRERLEALKRKKLELLDLQKRYRATHQLEFISPQEQQQPFFDALRNPDISQIVILGGNRCIAGSERIYDPVKNLTSFVEDIPGDFHVYAWDGEKVVIAKAKKPFTKGKGFDAILARQW